MTATQTQATADKCGCRACRSFNRRIRGIWAQPASAVKDREFVRLLSIQGRCEGR